MRTLIVLLTLVSASATLAQGVVFRMFAATGDETIIIAEAENAFSVPFIEVDREIPNAEYVMRFGILDGEGRRFVVITPSTIHVVERDGDQVRYSTPEWDDPIFTAANSRFNRRALTGEGSGRLLQPAPRAEGLGYTPSRVMGRSSVRSGYPSSTTCTSSYSASGSSITCTSGGRTTYTNTCRVNPVTNAITCTSRTY